MKAFQLTVECVLVLGFLYLALQYQMAMGRLKGQQAAHHGETDRQQQNLGARPTGIEDQQTRVSALHEMLSAQEIEIRKMRTELNDAQVRIRDQQKQIEDLEGLVRSVFSKTKTEMFAATDSNRVFHIFRGTGAVGIAFKLQAPAIANSIHVYFDQDAINLPVPAMGNVCCVTLAGTWDEWSDKLFTITYVPDPKSTVRFTKVEVKDDKLLVDGERFPD